MTQQDKSNYFKGLLILIGKDRKISEQERIILCQVAKILGFNKEFCDNAISELLDNEYIIESPLEFSNLEIAKSFVIDGIRIAFSDKEIHIFELNWLKSVSEKNSIDKEWCIQKYNDNQSSKHESEKFQIEIFLESEDQTVS
ncbi:MAG: hypothetical protein KGZ42_07030 [Melioribacter sp.]|nr:hypothetical protein [Melioribacter sp.]